MAAKCPDLECVDYNCKMCQKLLDPVDVNHELDWLVGQNSAERVFYEEAIRNARERRDQIQYFQNPPHYEFTKKWIDSMGVLRIRQTINYLEEEEYKFIKEAVYWLVRMNMI